ncbi:MAG: hypothetical protein IID37_14805 [Planctomycetes bacterium]|nr:hypothetical protein [Planctomycetota bacterium]
MNGLKRLEYSVGLVMVTSLSFVGETRGDCPFFAYETTWSMGGIGRDRGCSVAVGMDGPVVVAGAFDGIVDFDPSLEVDLHTSNGSNDIFVTRFHADGTYAWTRTMGAELGDGARAVAIDNSGAVLITGVFWQTVDFDPTAGVDLHESLGFTDVFVTKLTSDGDYAWTRTFGGTGIDGTWGIAVGTDGAVYAVGDFVGTVDFDPSEGIDEHESNKGSHDAFLGKLDPDGSYEWTVTFGGEDCDQPNSVIVDSETLYVAGHFCETTDFDPGVGVEERTSHGSFDAFVLNLSLDGDYEWVWTAGSTEIDTAQGVAVFDDGSVALTGYFTGGPVDFDASDGVDERFSNGLSDVFVTKLGSDGSYVWTYTAGGNESEVGHGIATTVDGDIVLAGIFGGDDALPGYTVDFDPSGGDPHASNGMVDFFVTMLKADGTYGWTYTAGGQGAELGAGIAASDSGKIYVTGDFSETVDFDPGESTDEHTAAGDHDIFLTTLQCVDDPPSCDGDANGDGLVDPLDSGFVLARFGCDVDSGDPDCDTADMNGDALVDPLDVGYVLARFGTCQ